MGQFDVYDTALSQATRQQDLDRTRHDRITYQSVAQRMLDLCKKEKLSVSEAKELATLCTSNELKAGNESSYERIAMGIYDLRIEDHATLLVLILQESNKYLELDKEPEKSIRTEEQQQLWEETKALRQIMERDLTEELRKAVNSYSYLKRSALSLGMEGLKIFAGEQKKFDYNVPIEQVPKEHRQ